MPMYEVEIEVRGTRTIMVEASSPAEVVGRARERAGKKHTLYDAKVTAAKIVRDPPPPYPGGLGIVGTHVSHCCVLHGCKYLHPQDDTKCPVVTRQYAQEYPCESCGPGQGEY